VKSLSLYIDTSVIGGYFDPEFTVATRELWRQMEKGQYRFYASSISVGEVARAPDEEREKGDRHAVVSKKYRPNQVAAAVKPGPRLDEHGYNAHRGLAAT
jgi:predicted nucleic acid-binding protein